MQNPIPFQHVIKLFEWFHRPTNQDMKPLPGSTLIEYTPFLSWSISVVVLHFGASNSGKHHIIAFTQLPIVWCVNWKTYSPLPSSGVCEKQWKVWSSSSSSPRRTRTQWYARVCVCVCVRKSYTCPSVTSSCICFPSILIECEKSCSLWRLCHLQGSIERMVQLLCR